MTNHKSAISNDLSLYVHEFFFLFNILFVAQITEGIRDLWAFRWPLIGLWENRLEFAIEAYFYHRSHPGMRYSPKDLPGHTAFLVVTTGMALAGVLLLTLLARTRIVKEVLRTFAGLTSVLMLPLCWLYTAALYREAYNLPDALRLWLYFELGLVVAVVFIFLFARRFLPGWIVAGLFVAHHILWGRLFLGGPYFWLSPFLTLVPVTGLCASMAWLVYASRQLRADNVI